MILHFAPSPTTLLTYPVAQYAPRIRCNLSTFYVNFFDCPSRKPLTSRCKYLLVLLFSSTTRLLQLISAGSPFRGNIIKFEHRKTAQTTSRNTFKQQQFLHSLRPRQNSLPTTTYICKGTLSTASIYKIGPSLPSWCLWDRRGAIYGLTASDTTEALRLSYTIHPSLIGSLLALRLVASALISSDFYCLIS
jgi:hypothetical protein